MQKILFIIPPNMTYNRFVNPGFNERVSIKKTGKYGTPITDMPLGVLSLSAYLKKHMEVEVRLIDFNVILNKLESFEFKSFSDMNGCDFFKKYRCKFSSYLKPIETNYSSNISNL